MILHDFIYEWDGKSRDGEKPIAWWPGRYRVRIIRLGDETADVRFLFPYAVVFKSLKTDAPMNVSLRNYIHNFAEKISAKYELEMEKTMWVEMGEPTMVAHLSPDRILSGEALYTISWRAVRPNELDLIRPDMADF